MVEAIKALQGQVEQNATLTNQGETSCTPRYTEVRVRPSAELRVDRSDEAADAWPRGRRVVGTLHPILLVTSSNMVESDPPTFSDDEETAENLYSESKEWWEEGRRGLGLHSELE